MTKLLDEVRYDIFRRVLAGMASTWGMCDDGEPQVKAAEALTDAAMKRLEELGIVGESRVPKSAAYVHAPVFFKEIEERNGQIEELSRQLAEAHTERERLKSDLRGASQTIGRFLDGEIKAR